MYSTSTCVVISISSLKSLAVAAWILVTNALVVTVVAVWAVSHAVATAKDAEAAPVRTTVSCVVFVNSTWIVAAFFNLIRGVYSETFAANLDSPTTFPMDERCERRARSVASRLYLASASAGVGEARWKKTDDEPAAVFAALMRGIRVLR